MLTANFIRNPIDHGDFNIWWTFLLAQFQRGGIGANSIDITNVAGALNVGLGFAGIRDGTANGEGTIEVTTAGTFTLVGSTPSVWHCLECSVSGTSVTFYLTATAYGDESFLHADMKNYYDAAKTGYYRIASRRTLAFVFIRAAGTLGRIVQTESEKLGFKDVTRVEYTDEAGVLSYKYLAKITQAIGAWNMNGVATTTIILSWNDGTYIAKIFKVSAMIYRDDGLVSGDLDQVQAAAIGIEAGVSAVNKVNVALTRRAGGCFTGANYDDAVMNRGFIVIEFET